MRSVPGTKGLPQAGPARRWTNRARMGLCAVGGCLGVLLSGTLAPVAHAQPLVALTPVVGFAGYYERNHWVPVDVIIQNRGPAAEATLSLDVDQAVDTQRLALGTMTWPVRLPAHAWTHVHIAVPGQLIDSVTSVDCLIGGQEVATAFLTGNAVSNVALVAVLTDNAQDAQFLTGSTEGAQGNPVLPVAINPLNFPVDTNALTALTAVAVTPAALGGLSAAQAAALRDWVKLGGLLIFMGTGPLPPGWQMMAPLEPGPPRTVSGQPLAVYAGNTSTKPGKVTIYAAQARPAAAVWAGNPSAPLVAGQPVGRGWVAQTAFSPLSPQLLGWSGNAELWTNLLGEGLPRGRGALPALLDPAGVLAMAAASDALSPLRIPSLRAWSAVFLVYAALAGPVLFFVLRRWKKEPWAWVALPALSVVTTLGIYGFGVAERPPGILTEGLGVLDLVGDGTAQAYGIRGFMAPFVMNARISAPGRTLALPLAEENVRQLGVATVQYRNGTEISYQGVGRWGIRYAFTSAPVNGQGTVRAQLWGSPSGLLYGHLQNGTRYTLHDVAVWWNGRMFAAGDLAPGEIAVLGDTTTVQAVDGNFLAAYVTYNRDLTRGFSRPLANFAAQNLLTAPPGASEAMIVATTSDTTPALPKLVTAQRIASEQKLVLVREFVPVTTRLE